MASALDVFSPRTRAWFERAFDGPTPPQELAWPAIASGEHVLIQAPTGSGKTLAAFLYGIDRLTEAPGEGLRLLYVSPLKALNYDIERNLRGPLAGLESELRVAVRTGDTPQKERREMLRHPPDILITTPESLYLLLTSQGARDARAASRRVILDEVHAVAGTKRGAHLALSLERLERLVAAPLQRIGLSATQRPMEEIGRFVSGGTADPRSSTPGSRRSSTCEVIVPVEDMRELAAQPALADALARRRAPRGPARARSGRRSTRSCSGSSRSTARRSCSSTTAASPSGSRCGSTSSPRRTSRAPTTARSRASSGSRSRSC